MREAHNSCLGKRLYEPSAKITIQKNKNRKTCIYLKANHLQRRVLKLAPLLTDNCCKRAALFVTLHRDKTKRRISTITVKRSLSYLCNNIFCP